MWWQGGGQADKNTVCFNGRSISTSLSTLETLEAQKVKPSGPSHLPRVELVLKLRFDFITFSPLPHPRNPPHYLSHPGQRRHCSVPRERCNNPPDFTCPHCQTPQESKFGGLGWCTPRTCSPELAPSPLAEGSWWRHVSL